MSAVDGMALVIAGIFRVPPDPAPEPRHPFARFT